jgi:hypothetical protein
MGAFCYIVGGVIGLPWAVPVDGVTAPSTMTPASSHFRSSFKTRRSLTRCSITLSSFTVPRVKGRTVFHQQPQYFAGAEPGVSHDENQGPVSGTHERGRAPRQHDPQFIFGRSLRQRDRGLDAYPGQRVAIQHTSG